jgi:hypothetical protein
VIACDVVRNPSRGHEVAMEDLRSKGGGGVCGPPDPGKGVEGGSADVAGRWEGGGLESGWVLVGPGEHPK